MSRILASLCCALLLCGPGAAAPPRHGHCVGDLCAFQAFLDFDGARDACGDLTGQLLTFSQEEDLGALPDLLEGFGGWLWLRGANATGEEGSARDCASASPSAEVLWRPCGDTLGGFLCRFQGVCAPVEPSGGARVTYNASGFDLNVSVSFPPGTVATAGRHDASYPDSKHLCYSSEWLEAPWPCEVLNGGCEGECVRATGTCECAPGSRRHDNLISCLQSPCAGHACVCDRGYRLAPDEKSCLDVNECEEGEPCTAAGTECVNTEGGYECTCADGFDLEDGACVNVSICSSCEHMNCLKFDGVYRCVCRKGYVVSPKDPTKCEPQCTQRDCLASCIPNTEGPDDCFCPGGYVSDTRGKLVYCTDIDECEQSLCDHRCENSFGSFRCSCNAGFQLRDGGRCVKDESPKEEEEEDEGGSGTDEPPPPAPVTPAGLQPAELPPFVKTGSILGIAVFLALCAALLALVARAAVGRCGRFELPTIKHPDLDLYYLQQVTTETYKRLSLERQQKDDAQRL